MKLQPPTRFPIFVSIFIFLPQAFVFAVCQFLLGLQFYWVLPIQISSFLICGALLQYYLISQSEYRGRVLFLRRFHLEKPPRFPLSRLIARLGAIGFEPITLADSIIEEDRDSKIPLASVMPLVVSIASYEIIILGISFFVCRFLLGITWTEFEESISTRLIASIVVIVFHAVGVALAEFFLRMITEYLISIIIKIIPNLSINIGERSKSEIDIFVRHRLRSRWTLGLTVIKSSDSNWEYLVHELIKTSSIICVDISNPSRHLLAEISALSRFRRGTHVVWIHAEGSVVPLVHTGHYAYSIFGYSFEGPFCEFVYPDSATLRMYDQVFQSKEEIDKQFLRLMSSFPEYWPVNMMG